jgi:hypothetical protein
VLSWAHGHREQFFSGPTVSGLAPAGGWAGRRELEGGGANLAEGYIGFLPHRLDEILRAGEFEPDPIRRLWFDRGWLKVAEGRRQYRTRMGNGLVYMVAIKRSAIEEVEGPAAAVEDDRRQYVPFSGARREASS